MPSSISISLPCRFRFWGYITRVPRSAVRDGKFQGHDVYIRADEYCQHSGQRRVHTGISRGCVRGGDFHADFQDCGCSHYVRDSAGLKKPIHLSGTLRIRFSPEIVRRIMKVGIPTGMDNCIFQIGKILVQKPGRRALALRRSLPMPSQA